MEKVFRRAFFTVRSADSGRDALDILRREEIPVMFLDLKMPEMDGVELCRRVRQDC